MQCYAIFPAASGNDTRCVFFFTCFFLSNTSLGPNHQYNNKPPDDDSPAYSKEHDDDLHREETTQPFISTVGSCLCCCTCTIDFLNVQCRPHCPEIVLFGFRGECRSGDPNKSTLPIIFQLCASSIFFRAHISRGKGSLHTT